MTAMATKGPGRAVWLVLAYRLPARPGLKASIRRRLAALGAVYLANAVAAVPASPAAERAFRGLRSMIGDAGGSAQVLRAEAIEGGRALAGAFNTARENEYGEIITGCGDFVAGVEDMTAAGHFLYSGLAEKDTELKRLSARHATIRRRDILGAANADSALYALARCRAVLDDFASRVYQTETGS